MKRIMMLLAATAVLCVLAFGAAAPAIAAPPPKAACLKAIQHDAAAFNRQQAKDKRIFDRTRHTKAQRAAFAQQQDAARKAFKAQLKARAKAC